MYGTAIIIKGYVYSSTLSYPFEMMFPEQMLVLEDGSGNFAWTDSICLVTFFVIL